MTCERYWRDGVLLVEQGLPDPHRDSCSDCRREHEARQELVRAVALVGVEDRGDPGWQRAVWRRISREVGSTASPLRWVWLGGGALAAACALVVAMTALRGGSPGEPRPRIETIPGPVAVRAAAASVGDRVRVSILPTQEVRIYQAERIVRRCAADIVPAEGCARDADGLVAELAISLPGKYQILIVTDGASKLEGGKSLGSLSGAFDQDAAALTAAGIGYQVQPYQVR